MHTANEIWIDASPETVFRLAEAVERWPEMLPHYRYVRLLRHDGHSRVVEMSAYRGRIPTRWTSILRPLPEQMKLRFTHIRGITKGMDVEWRLRDEAGGTHVTIEHWLRLGWPPGVRTIGEWVIGRYFVRNVAGKTLRRMKELAEAQTER